MFILQHQYKNSPCSSGFFGVVDVGSFNSYVRIVGALYEPLKMKSSGAVYSFILFDVLFDTLLIEMCAFEISKNARNG